MACEGEDVIASPGVSAIGELVGTEEGAEADRIVYYERSA